MPVSCWKTLLLCTASLILPETVHAQSYADQASPQPYPAPVRAMPLQPRVDVGGRVGTERSIGVTEAWLPISQTPEADKVLYTDIRWMGDDESNQEGNLGVGYRAIVDDISGAGGAAIIGAHGWIDRRRTDRGSNFHQVTVGVEYLKEDWDVKVNAYAPLNSEKEYLTPNLGSTTPYLAGTGLFVDTNGLLVEEAQPGADIEVGYRIPTLEQDIDAIRVYGGAYGFKGDRSDDVIGGRVRASVDINPLINVGARFQYDEPRGSQGFLEATLRFPFTAKKRFQSQGLKARMDESPERDIDIVTGGTVVDNGLRKEVINTASGATQRVLHVDNTATPGGNGSKENPFNTLAAAQAALLANDVVYVHAGNGTTTGQDQGITIDKDNVQLIGSGTDFIFDTDRFTVRRPGPNGTDGSLILAATAAPVITNNQASVDNTTGNGVYGVADNLFVAGITVSGATGSGIFISAQGGQQFGSATVKDTTTAGNGRDGLRIQASGAGSSIGSMTVENISSLNNAIGGIRFLSSSGAYVDTATLSNATISGNVANGAEVNVSGTMNNVFITDVTSTANARGVYIVSQLSGTIGTINVTDINSNNNAEYGIGVRSLTSGTISQATVSSSNTSNNTQYGLIIDTQSAGKIENVTADTIISNGNTLDGVRIATANTGSIINNIEANHITANGNATFGFSVIANGGAISNVMLDDITANNNTSSGLQIYALSTSSSINSMAVSNSRASNNGAQGVLIRAQNSGIIDGLSLNSMIANANSDNGLHLYAQNAASVITNIAVSNSDFLNNTQNGLYLQKSSSTGVLQADLGGGALNSAGQNRSFGNAGKDLRLNYTGGGNVTAQQNWWGDPSGLQPARVTLSAGTTVDTVNFLTTDPRP